MARCLFKSVRFQLSRGPNPVVALQFDDFEGREFLPTNEAYRDETRKALDRELLFGITSVLQLDPALEEGLDLLRGQ